MHELVGNARKHSRATSLRVALADQNGAVVAEVVDDGIGFRTSAARSIEA